MLTQIQYLYYSLLGDMGFHYASRLTDIPHAERR